ncbi:MAG: histidine kinase [Erysipelotrichaceae bacterium]|nr:histidine kinase [Erysipelotrichaceae bacterium]
MKNSWRRVVIILLSSILVTSVLFFVVMTISYNNVYMKTVLSNNEHIASSWSSAIDTRLNTVYEHLYDLVVNVYNNTDVRSGSPEMDYDDRKKLQDLISAKMMASNDLTCMFIIDKDSDLYFYSGKSTLSQPVNYNLKIYLQSYSKDNISSLNNRRWDLINVLEEGYYYKSIQLGKYIIGAISDCSLYRIENLNDPGIQDGSFFIQGDQSSFCVSGNSTLANIIDSRADSDYFQNGFAVSRVEQNSANATSIFITKPAGFSTQWRLAALFLILDSAICVILVAVLSMNIDKKLRIPIRELVKANQEVAKGDFGYKLDVESAGSSEFEELYSSFNDMSSKIENLTIEAYDLKLKREENRLKMLRAQMRPHTFLNGISTVSNMTYTSTPEQIRKYIAAFAKFTRYMLNKSNDWTTVGEELNNIENYVTMQKIRFPDSINMIVECDPDVLATRIPYLILFSLVENSFKHAMTLVSTMELKISGCQYEEEGFKGIKLTEEDNGTGFSEEAFAKLEKIDPDELYTKEHLGLTNVRYSLNMIYKRDDLLRLSNKPEGGAIIELLIPQQEVEDETAGM